MTAIAAIAAVPLYTFVNITLLALLSRKDFPKLFPEFLWQ